MGTHPIFESDFDCLTDFSFWKFNKSIRDQYPSLPYIVIKHIHKGPSKIENGPRKMLLTIMLCAIFGIDLTQSKLSDNISKISTWGTAGAPGFDSLLATQNSGPMMNDWKTLLSTLKGKARRSW